MIITQQLITDKFLNIYEFIKPSVRENYWYVRPIHNNPDNIVAEVKIDQCFDFNKITKH